MYWRVKGLFCIGGLRGLLYARDPLKPLFEKSQYFQTLRVIVDAGQQSVVRPAGGSFFLASRSREPLTLGRQEEEGKKQPNMEKRMSPGERLILEETWQDYHLSNAWVGCSGEVYRSGSAALLLLEGVKR